MKYLTKEELEQITGELIENPTRETLRRLSEKYNENNILASMPKEESIMNSEKLLPERTTAKVEKVINETNSSNQTIEIPKVENTYTVPNQVESIGLNQQVVDTNSIYNPEKNKIIQYDNIFEMPTLEIGNLMQTTENFSTVQSTMPTTEVPVAPAPFFGPAPQTVNNPIPVETPVNNVPNMGPSMFGQFQQNYM